MTSSLRGHRPVRRAAHRVPLLLSIAALALAPALSGCGSDSTPAEPTTTAATSSEQATSTTAASTTATSTAGEASGTSAASATPTAAGSIAVPDVRGERPARADQTLTEAGLHANITGGTTRGPGGGQCVITEQTPQAGTSVTEGTTIELGTGEVGGGSC